MLTKRGAMRGGGRERDDGARVRDGRRGHDDGRRRLARGSQWVVQRRSKQEGRRVQSGGGGEPLANHSPQTEWMAPHVAGMISRTLDVARHNFGCSPPQVHVNMAFETRCYCIFLASRRTDVVRTAGTTLAETMGPSKPRLSRQSQQRRFPSTF